MENVKPGSILINTTTNKLYGVLVSILPNNKIIVFRLDKNTHPIFSKLDIHPHIAKVGIINEFQYSTLKNALLKYYRTYNLTPSEKKMMESLMIFAFPIGIPEYQPNIELPERDIESMDLHSKLTSGKRIMINTPNRSCYKHLDNKTVDIIEKNENGIWVNLPTNEQDITKLGNNMIFLFYKNRETPTFGGISRILPIYDNNDNNDNRVDNSSDTTNLNNSTIIEAYKKLKENDELTTMMEYNGDNVRIIPNNRKIIFPDIYKNMIYNPHTDSFTIEKENITPALSTKLGNKLIISGADSKGKLMELSGMGMDNDLVFKNIESNSDDDNYISKININEDGELVYEGGGRKKKQSDIDIINNTNNNEDIVNLEYYENSISKYKSIFPSIEDNDNDNDDFTIVNSDSDSDSDSDNNIKKEKLQRKRLISKSSNGSNASNTDSEYDEETFEDIVDEDDIEILDTFQKVKKVELGELEKVYKESIQKGDLMKYKLEKLPIFKRNNTEIIKNINKEINILSLLKNNISKKINGIHQINFKPQDYKPLVSKYIKGDFTNKYLIPLVINRKKIYLNKDKKIDTDDYDLHSNEIIEDFLSSIHNISYLQEKKNISLNNDVYTQKLINELNPTSTNENDSLGMLFRLGEKLNVDDFSRLSQDTITIKYCDKPMKCNSYGMHTMNFDCQVNLGPMGRYISDDQDQDLKNIESKADLENPKNTEDSEELNSPNFENNNDYEYENNNETENEYEVNKHINILYSKPKFKVYYQGDLIRIIGYIRPPLKYFDNPEHNILNNLYKSQKQKNEIITINLEDINPEIVDDNDNDNDSHEDKFSISQHPDKFIIFLMPKEGYKYNNIEKQIEKIIPSIDDIIKLYLNKSKNNSVNNIYNILNKFEYDYNELTFDMYNKIIKEQETYTELFNNIDSKLQSKFELYKKKVTQNKKIKEENEKKFKHRIIEKDDKDSKNSSKSNSNKYKYITNDVMDDIASFYFNTYSNKNISIDTDYMRLMWFEQNFDNGRFLFKTLLINYLKMYKDEHNIENLETEFAIIKEKHIMMSQQSNQFNQNVQTSTQLMVKNSSPNIIKYPSLERLDKDNGKVAIDSDGNVIMNGDYALVNVGNDKQLFKREVIGNIDMWIKEDIAMLYKLINDKRNKCVENPELSIEKDNLYDFDMDRLKCIPKDAIETSIDNMSETHKIELYINQLQKEIDFIKNIPILIANLNKEIINERLYLINKVNSTKQYIKYKEAEALKLEEHIKSTIKTIKPCIHFQITDYFHNIKSDNEKYIFADNIFKQFEDTELDNKIGSKNDYNNYDKNDNERNFTHCNICSQRLLCNHHKLAVSYLNNEQKNKYNVNHNHNHNHNHNQIDYDRIIDIYGFEQDGSYVCSACNISIQTTEIIDVEDFAKGEDGGVIKTREIAKDIPIIEKQKQYINNVINTLFEDNEGNRVSLTERINIFKLMKILSNIEMFSIKDEVDMLNFLKSYQFDKKETIFLLIKEQIGTSNLQLLKKLVDKTYLTHLIADIGVRFLITLQTSTVNYKINNNFINKIKNETYSEECNNTSIIGYPLINNVLEKNGIIYMMCLFSQMGIYPEYSPISDYKEIKFIEKIRKQVENDNMVKDKIQSALFSKSNTINNINEFEDYYTNHWREYKPRLEYTDITWVPEKILNSANLKEVTYNNIDKMINVGIENTIYYSLNVINKINYVIENSLSFNKSPMLLNNCCPEKYNEKKYFNYMDYFNKYNSDIVKYTNLFKDVNDILSKIKNIVNNPINNIIYEPLYKPSQIIFKVQFNITNSDIKDMYLKYIDSGIHKGKEHIYDKYGRCTLSNTKKVDIENQSYSMQDYTRIQSSISSGNELVFKKDTHNMTNMTNMTNITNIEIKKIDELINNIPNLDIFKYLKDFFNKIKESEDDIFEDIINSNNDINHDINDIYKNKLKVNIKNNIHKTSKFDIYKHLGDLNSHIDDEINNLVKKITSTEKNINKYKKIMRNIGDFKKLYEDYKINNSNDININEKSELFRYSKKEDYIQFTIKYLNDIINQIKYNKLSNPLNKDKIRTQYRDFLNFGEKHKLFKILGDTTRKIYDFVKIIKSKQKYKILFPELVSNILHYLNIISLSNLFNILNKNSNYKEDNENINFNFKIVDNDKNEYNMDNNIIDLNKELHLDEEYVLDTEEDINFIESFEIKNSENLKTISEFIIKYLDNISKNQETYDELTDKRIKTEITNFDQKRIERTLKAFKILNEEGNEETKMLLYVKMNVLKKLNYANLAENVEKIFEDDTINMNDSIDNYEEKAELSNDYIPGEYDNDDLNEFREIGNVISREDDDEGDQDYNRIAVDD